MSARLDWRGVTIGYHRPQRPWERRVWAWLVRNVVRLGALLATLALGVCVLYVAALLLVAAGVVR